VVALNLSLSFPVQSEDLWNNSIELSSLSLPPSLYQATFTKMGCDGVIDSGKVNDACGECGGEGATCKGCDGEVGRSPPPHGCRV